MPVHIQSGLTDDNDFIKLVRTIVNGVLTRQSPDQVWIIHINNWFDHKWLRFSGYGGEASWMFSGSPGPARLDSLASRFDRVKGAFFKTKTTFPPFTPERVLGQWSFEKSGDEYVEFALPRVPHEAAKSHSETNLNRRLTHFSQSAVFVWYSANTLANGRGSLMVYSVSGTTDDCWFASFHRNLTWSLAKTKSISREKVLLLINPDVSP